LKVLEKLTLSKKSLKVLELLNVRNIKNKYVKRIYHAIIFIQKWAKTNVFYLLIHIPPELKKSLKVLELFLEKSLKVLELFLEKSLKVLEFCK